ncbi:MAG TPA: hypothetical protein VFM53_00360 [Anaeromyxobacteraceae bacterium]|nr:hypothetical protein [Anaeromyxobacteraceae bacterium]
MAERPEGDPRVVTEALDRGRRAVAGLAEGFRRTGRWKRMRLGFVGGWLVASVVALFIACPRSGPANSLGADVQLLRDSLLGQQILVRNESDVVWTDVVLLLEGGWRHEVRTLRPREQVVLSPSQFDRAGEPAPRDLRPRRLSIECGQGSATVDLR